MFKKLIRLNFKVEEEYTHLSYLLWGNWAKKRFIRIMNSKNVVIISSTITNMRHSVRLFIGRLARFREERRKHISEPTHPHTHTHTQPNFQTQPNNQTHTRIHTQYWHPFELTALNTENSAAKNIFETRLNLGWIFNSKFVQKILYRKIVDFRNISFTYFAYNTNLATSSQTRSFKHLRNYIHKEETKTMKCRK